MELYIEAVVCNCIVLDSVTGIKDAPVLSSFITVNVREDFSNFIITRAGCDRLEFNLKELSGFYTDDAYPDRLAVRFSEQKKNVIVLCQDLEHIQTILFFIRRYMTLNDWNHIVNDEYKFDMGSFSCLKRYDFKSTKDNITNLILENVVVSSLKGLTSMSHIKCINLSGSTLGRTPFEKDTFWNWMNYPNIEDSLTVLLLDSINLTEVPFELQYLSKLKTLSMAHNNLTSLPHFLEMPSWSSLFVNNNSLTFLPKMLQYITFENINIEGNMLKLPNSESLRPQLLVDEEPKVPDTLCNLALYSIVKNKVKCDRQDIIRLLWKHFNSVSTCKKCNRPILVTPYNICYEIGLVRSYNYQSEANIILWQYPNCLYNCATGDDC